jgi:hypothetical protein
LGDSVEACCGGHGVVCALDKGVGGVDEPGADGFGDGHDAVGVDIGGGDPSDLVVWVTAVGGGVDVGVGPVVHGAGRAGEVGVLGGDVADHAGDVDGGGQGLLQVVGGFAQVDTTGHDFWVSPGGFVVGDFADGGAQLAGCLDQVQVGAAVGASHLGPPAGDVGPGLLCGVEGGCEAVLVGVRVDVACAGAGDAGQNSEANFAHLTGSGLHYVGSVPPSDCPDLLALPAAQRTPVDGFPGLSAIDTRRVVYGATRRVVLTHSESQHDDQARSFTGTTLAKAGRLLDELAATLARGKTRRTRPAVEAEIAAITHNPWLRRVIDIDLTGATPAEHRLTWSVNQQKRRTLENEVFGKRILLTDHDHWTMPDVVAGYRSQSEIEFGFRQLKDHHQVSFSPMFHWTEHNIAVHTFTCVLALQLAHLMRLKAHRAGHEMPVRAILDTLAGIGETVLLYPSTGGRPKAHRMTTDMTADQHALYDLFDLHRWAPANTT